MKTYLLELTENISDQAIADLEEFGVEIIYASKLMPNLISVKSEKSIEELEKFFLIESAGFPSKVTLGGQS